MAVTLATLLLTTACGSSDTPPANAAEPLNAQEREWLAQYAKNKKTESAEEREILSAAPAKEQPSASPPPAKREPRALLTKMPGGMKLTPTNAISRDLVQQQVNAVLPDLVACYELEVANDPALAGKVTLGWTVTTKGKVTSPRIVEATLPSDSVKACMMRTATEMKFPKGKAVKVEYPFQFSALGG